MSEDLPTNLIEKGVNQGTFFSHSNLSFELENEIKENRAVKGYRNKPISENHLLIILSQDCDISNSCEKYLEVLVAKKCKAKEINPVAQKARNLRKLQLPIDNEYWICDVNLISHISKELFLKEFPSIEGQLEGRSKEILLHWRVNRYTREPLPDKFNKALLDDYIRHDDSGFAQFLEKNYDYITDLYIFVSPDDNDVDDYLVSITALLNIHCDNEKAEEISKELFGHLTTLHECENGLKMIQVDDSFIPDKHQSTLDIVAKPEDFSMLDTYNMKRLTLDYMCWPDDEED